MLFRSTQMAYTGTDVMMRPGGMGMGEQKPEDFDPGQVPEGEVPTMPEGMEPPEGMEKGDRPEMPEGEMPTMQDGWKPGEEIPEGMEPPKDGRGDRGTFTGETGDPNTAFYMQDKVNFFSGLSNA